MATKIVVTVSKRLERVLSKDSEDKMSAGIDRLVRLVHSIELLWMKQLAAAKGWQDDAVIGSWFSLKNSDSTKLFFLLRRSRRVTIDLTVEEDDITLRFDYVAAKVQFHGHGRHTCADPEIVFTFRESDGRTRRVRPNESFISLKL